MPDDTPGGRPDDSVPDCVADLMAQGHDESSAYAICNAEMRAGEMAADVFRIIPSEDDGREFQSDVLALGVDLPNAGVYVDWNIDAWPDGEQLQDPHVSVYGNMDDAAQVAEGEIEMVKTVSAGGGSASDTRVRHRSVGVDVSGTAPATQRATSEFDPDDPPAAVREAIEADDFVIYGKASVEKVDLAGTRISVDALERALGRFFDSKDAPGIISRGHSDVVVGVPVREHTLEHETTLAIDDETYHFEAGETIRTEPKDADGDDVEELWLVSRLANDTDIARETRYKALMGELNGYSVTVKPKDGATRQTDEGEDILAVDLHAVTVGTDEQILNKGSEFDVAEFRAMFDHNPDLSQLTDDALDDAIDTLAEDLGQRLRDLVT